MDKDYNQYNLVAINYDKNPKLIVCNILGVQPFKTKSILEIFNKKIDMLKSFEEQEKGYIKE